MSIITTLIAHQYDPKSGWKCTCGEDFSVVLSHHWTTGRPVDGAALNNEFTLLLACHQYEMIEKNEPKKRRGEW